ncbi:Uncharacterised protein [Halioglobus japonicus]|nr:Uncharacterised protein [Halioglobus japonicus]
MEGFDIAGTQFMEALHAYLTEVHAAVEADTVQHQVFADLVTVYLRFEPTQDELAFVGQSITVDEKIRVALQDAEVCVGSELVDAFRRLLLHTKDSDERGFSLLMLLGRRIRVLEEEYAYMVDQATITVEGSGALWFAAPSLTQCVMALSHGRELTNYRDWLWNKDKGAAPKVKRRGRREAVLAAVLRAVATKYPDVTGGAEARDLLLASDGKTISVTRDGKAEKVRITAGGAGTSQAFVELTPEYGPPERPNLEYIRKRYSEIR